MAISSAFRPSTSASWAVTAWRSFGYAYRWPSHVAGDRACLEPLRALDLRVGRSRQPSEQEKPEPWVSDNVIHEWQVLGMKSHAEDDAGAGS
jgi:hypothetical protein